MVPHRLREGGWVPFAFWAEQAQRNLDNSHPTIIPAHSFCPSGAVSPSALPLHGAQVSPAGCVRETPTCPRCSWCCWNHPRSSQAEMCLLFLKSEQEFRRSLDLLLLQTHQFLWGKRAKPKFPAHWNSVGFKVHSNPILSVILCFCGSKSTNPKTPRWVWIPAINRVSRSAVNS